MDRILVTGGTGTVGRPLVDALGKADVRIRLVGRRAPTWRTPSNVEFVERDLSNPRLLEPALEDVSAIFIHPRAVKLSAAPLLTLAAARGVRRVVAYSATNVDDDPDDQPSRYLGDRNLEVEQAVVASGLEWTVLRPATFMSNIVQMWAPQLARGDIIRGAYGGAREAQLDPRDLAETIARLLIDGSHIGERIELTGPCPLSFAEMATLLSFALDRPIGFKEVPAEVMRVQMIGAGLAPQFVDSLLRRNARLAQTPGQISDGVMRVLGREPRSFTEWARDNRSAFPAPALEHARVTISAPI